jgi:hypothetical protein
MAEITAMLSTTGDMQPPREEAITQSSSSAVDAHFSAAWDGFTGRGAESTSAHGHFLPAFEEEGWYHDSLTSVDAVDAPTAPEVDGQFRP